MLTEGIGHSGQGLTQMLLQQLLVRHVIRKLAQAIHVVGKAEEAGGDIRHQLEGMADHGGAHYFAEGADMRQPRGAVAGLEEDVALVGRLAANASQELPGLLERPGLRCQCQLSFARHGRPLHIQTRMKPEWPISTRCLRPRKFVNHSGSCSIGSTLVPDETRDSTTTALGSAACGRVRLRPSTPAAPGSRK